MLIAFDNDAAGNSAALKLAEALREKGIEPWRVIFPAGMDANDYLLASEQKALAFQLLLDQALPMAADGALAAAVKQVEAAEVGKLAGSEAAEKVEAVGVTADFAASSSSSSSSSVASEPGLVSEWLDNGDLSLTLLNQQWRLRGLTERSRHSLALKLNVQVLDLVSGVLFCDHLDLLSARSRQGYARLAALELGCDEASLRRALGRVLLWVEQYQTEQKARVQAEASAEAAPVLSADQQSEALALLRSPQLLARITQDLAACGVVGERSNLLAAYLAATSRRLDKPLAILIQSSSAAGKSSLMDAVLNLMPPEERLQYSAMTGQSLFYLGEVNVKHKILAIAEEEGVRQAAYALKLLQSDGELTIASTAKDEVSGNLVTKQYRVEGPVMLMLTSTAIDIDEELLNRCLVLTVNESREQTEAIHQAQRQAQTLAGLLASRDKHYLSELHQNAQRLLRPLKVVNPFAQQLSFISDKTRTRRDHMKYLSLIQSIALLHQYQREVKQVSHRGEVIDYIEVTAQDIQHANPLAQEILGRTLDELPPQTRQLLKLIGALVAQLASERKQALHEVRFTRRDIRAFTQWSDNQLKVHCLRLAEMEYLQVLGGCRGQLLQYALIWRLDEDDQHQLCALIDVLASAKPASDSESEPETNSMNAASWDYPTASWSVA